MALPACEPGGPDCGAGTQLRPEHSVGVYRLQAHVREEEGCRVHAVRAGGGRGRGHKPAAHVRDGRRFWSERDAVEGCCRRARADVELRGAQADAFQEKEGCVVW